MTNIAQYGYGDIRNITYRPKTKSSSGTNNAAFPDALSGIAADTTANADELIHPIEENGVPERWTSDRLYKWDASPKGYSVNAKALSRVRDQLKAEGKDSSGPTHELTEEQRAWLESRYDIDYINACSRESSEFGNFMLDLAYLNVFSLDEVENFFGVLPPTNEYQAVSLYYHGNPATGKGAGYVDIFGYKKGSGELIAPEEWQTQHITQYLKTTYSGLTDKERQKMTREITEGAQERGEILDGILERLSGSSAASMCRNYYSVNDASGRLKEDFGGLNKTGSVSETDFEITTMTELEFLLKNAPDKWVTEPGISLNAAVAAAKYRKELGLPDSEPTHELTSEQREWLLSRHDLSSMRTTIGYSYQYGKTTQYGWKSTPEYSNFLADLAYLGIFTPDEFILTSPLDTRPGAHSGTLTEYANSLLNSDGGVRSAAKLFVDHLQSMFSYYNERSKSSLAVPGDEEFAEMIRERYLPINQKFFEFIDDLIKCEEQNT